MTNLSAEDLACLVSRLSEPIRSRFSREGASSPSHQALQDASASAYSAGWRSGLLIGSLYSTLLTYLTWAAITGMILPGLPISSLTGTSP